MIDVDLFLWWPPLVVQIAIHVNDVQNNHIAHMYL